MIRWLWRRYGWSDEFVEYLDQRAAIYKNMAATRRAGVDHIRQLESVARALRDVADFWREVVVSGGDDAP